MKVFIVVGEREQGIYGVFDTEELADKYTKLLNHKYIMHMYEVIEHELITNLNYCIWNKSMDSLEKIYSSLEEANEGMKEYGTRNYELRKM